jgi:hypothetical protein
MDRGVEQDLRLPAVTARLSLPPLAGEGASLSPARRLRQKAAKVWLPSFEQRETLNLK